MLLSNYGRDQVGESFDGSQQSPSVEVPSPSAVVDRSLNLKTPPADQMLAAAACQRPQQQQEQRRLKPHSDQVLKCPRCDSMNTKFCYYNNYSLTQPRHFCKNCKRYWTKGGALRNVPVGGGCRKNKRVKQRHQDQGHPPPSGTSDELPTGAASGSPDGASSSSILQQEFPAPYEVPKSLPFEPRIFPGTTNPPISINWAGQLSSQAYDPSILGLNLPTTGIKQEPVHGADINSIFDPGLSSYMSMNIPVENFGINTAPPTAPDVLWRFPQQPKLVSLLEDGNEQEARGLLELGEKIKQHKGKTSGESMQVSGEYDQQGDSSSSPEWQHTPDGFFEAAPETGYWSGNGAWSSELHSYSATPGTGNHQML